MTRGFTGLKFVRARVVIFQPVFRFVLFDVRSPEKTIPEVLHQSLVKFRKRVIFGSLR
ncbi:hypothetical protein CASFOL_035352 [Castilleja foliolosa]|uniref:Uncharacterized protein n=1 Tax=Castilleja foliolosa TaxID=1961234 RepID=A0ABD3BUQ8_9LAMI